MIGRRNFALLILPVALFVACAALSGCGAAKNEGAMLSKPIVESVEASFTVEDSGDASRLVKLEMTGRLPSFPGSSDGPSFSESYFNARYRITSTDLASPATPLGECTTAGGEFKFCVNMLSSAQSFLQYRYPLITIYDNSTGIAVYRAVPGRLPQAYELPDGLKKLYVKNVRLDALSSARAAVLMERGAPDIPITRMTRREVADGVITRVLPVDKATEFEAAADARFGGAANVVSLSYAAEETANALARSKLSGGDITVLVPFLRDTPAAVAQTYVRLLNYSLFSTRISRRELNFTTIGTQGSYSFKIGASTPAETIPGLFSGIPAQEIISAD